MSSILEGLYKEEEQSADSELRRKLEKVESILGTRTDRNGRLYNEYVNDITKNIKYLQQDELVMEIYSKMQSMAQAIGLSEKELDYVEDDVREAFNNLESAVYKMEEPFEDYVRDLQYKVEELELDEGMYDQEAFDNIFKDRKDKGTMERPKARPTRTKPKDTGMYNQPNKADKDKEGEQLTEAQFDEAAGEKDACYHKVKSRYKVWPSAYASGALVKCRKVGAKNWGKTTTKEDAVSEGKSKVSNCCDAPIEGEIEDNVGRCSKCKEMAKCISSVDEGQRCWKGYEKKGTKKMFGKTVNNCVKKESVEEDLKAWFGKGKDGGAGGGRLGRI